MLTVVLENGTEFEFEKVSEFYENEFEIGFDYEVKEKQYSARFMFNNIAGFVLSHDIKLGESQ